MRFIFSVFLILTFVSTSVAQPYQPNWSSLNTRGIPDWFNKDKFGIFIHWGVYAVPAYAPVIPNSGLSYSEWYWQRIESGEKAFTDFHEKNYGKNFPYHQLEKQFRAELYDPAYWASIFKRSGARYVVLTSKHHEGYTLWPNKQADSTWKRPWNAVSGTPGRDLLGDLTSAVRDSGLRMGYYYSLYEWFNPLWKSDRNAYVRHHMTPQFKDLVNTYKPDLIFADGEWDMPDSLWHSPELLAWLFNESPVKDYVVVNDRWGSNTRHRNTGATYTTSEYGAGMNPDIIWEESRGIGHSYGYNRKEGADDYKSGRDLILILVDIVSRGGNLLLDIGPTADGRIPVIMQQKLLEIGSFLQQNGEAIYETSAWSTTRQWSEGVIPKQKGDSYMAGYDIARMIIPNKDTAHIEYFFTRKGRDLYCFIPRHTKEVVIKHPDFSANTQASHLATGKRLAIKKSGSSYVIDMSPLAFINSGQDMQVIKLANALRE